MDKMKDARRQTLAMLVDNESGVLSQIARLFSRKGYNIEADEPHTELLCNQLRKLYPVYSVKWLNTENSIYRELMLIKVKAEGSEQRNDVIQLANIFRAQIIDVSHETLTLGLTGDHEKLSAMEKILSEFETLEIARTGVVAIERGTATINDESKERGEFNYGKNVL